MSLGTIILFVAAVAMGTAACTIIGTIILANLLGNYEKAVPVCFWGGLAGSVAALFFQADVAAAVHVSQWIIGIAVVLILGWLAIVFGGRKSG